jgi:hypothetical protein
MEGFGPVSEAFVRQLPATIQSYTAGELSAADVMERPPSAASVFGAAMLFCAQDEVEVTAHFAPTSKRCGVLAKGEVVEALQTQFHDDGLQTAGVQAAGVGLRIRLENGWCTVGLCSLLFGSNIAHLAVYTVTEIVLKVLGTQPLRV